MSKYLKKKNTNRLKKEHIFNLFCRFCRQQIASLYSEDSDAVTDLSVTEKGAGLALTKSKILQLFILMQAGQNASSEMVTHTVNDASTGICECRFHFHTCLLCSKVSACMWAQTGASACLSVWCLMNGL